MVSIRRRIRFLALALIATTNVIATQMTPSGVGAPLTARAAFSGDVALVASQAALIMNGTFAPVITQEWMNEVMQELVAPAIGAGYVGTAMATPEEFWPVTGLFSMTFDGSIKTGHGLLSAKVAEELQQDTSTPPAIFGYSQSAVISSVQKRLLAEKYADTEAIPPVAFVMAGNPLRPNGGFLSRFPILAQVLTPWANMTSTPTDTPFATYDIVHQYEMWADFPTYPLNLLADVNALFGLMNHWYLPDSMSPAIRDLIQTVSLDPTSPDYNPATVVQHYGDTTYYTVPAEHLPMLYPLRWLGLGPLTDIVEPTLRVLIELGYDRTSSPGEVVRAGLIPNIDFGKLMADLNAAFAEGTTALRALLTPRVANSVGELSGKLAAEPKAVVARRGSRPAAHPPASAAGLGAHERADLPAHPRRSAAGSHSPSSKIATARVHPADAA